MDNIAVAAAARKIRITRTKMCESTFLNILWYSTIVTGFKTVSSTAGSKKKKDSRMFKATQNCHLPSCYPMQTPSNTTICNFTVFPNVCIKTLKYFYVDLL